MVEDVGRYCQQRKMRYVHDDAPTCLPGTMLRDMLKTFHDNAVNDVDREAFRPYTSHGGRDQQSNHKTKSGMLRSVKQALNDLPEETWVEADVDPDNPYLRSLMIRQPYQTDAISYTLAKKYFKPNIVAERAREFDQTMLTTDQINDAIVNMTATRRNFGFLGVVRPVIAETQSILYQLHLLWSIRDKRDRPTYKVFGVVWNTDAGLRGSHWICVLFFPFERRYEYFDSMAGVPNDDVGCQLKILKQEMARLAGFSNLEWDGRLNRTKHQIGGIQCGMYTIWYIHQRIVMHQSFDEIASHPTHDADICALRPEHFVHAHSRIRKAIQARESELRRVMKEIEREEKATASFPKKRVYVRKRHVTKEDAIVLEARRYSRKLKHQKQQGQGSRVRIHPLSGIDPEAQDTEIFTESKCPPTRIEFL